MWVPEMPFQMACQLDAGLKERPLAFLSPDTNEFFSSRLFGGSRTFRSGLRRNHVDNLLHFRL